MQALLSLTAILGPLLAGTAFEQAGTAAPYALGSLLSLAALAVVWAAFRQQKSTASNIRPAAEPEA
jgi:predicted MFS family arabinose efflux permease